MTLHTPQPGLAVDFRSAIGRFVTGVTIVTTRADQGPLGATANSLTSVSLDPCLLLVCLRNGSLTGQAIKSRGGFAVNLLSRDQAPLALRFARPADDRFRDIEVIDGPMGLPLIGGSLAHLPCRLASVSEAGDHEIFMGEVLHATHDPDADPLVFRAGAFGRWQPDER